MRAAPIHAGAVTLRGRGVLIAGASGSGKTRLALALVREARRDGHVAAFVADDRVQLDVTDDGLMASSPPTISGLVEIRGLGPVPVRAQASCRVELLVRLVPPPEAPRLADARFEAVESVRLPVLLLPERDSEGAVWAVNGFLFGTEF